MVRMALAMALPLTVALAVSTPSGAAAQTPEIGNPVEGQPNASSGTTLFALGLPGTRP